jgi:hypothetical protein
MEHRTQRLGAVRVGALVSVVAAGVLVYGAMGFPTGSSPRKTGYGSVKSVNVQPRAAAPVRISIVRVRAEWIDPAAQSHWQILLTWTSRGAISCAIYDSAQKRWFHKDPTGETARPYGQFARSVRGVGLVFRCVNVADAPSFSSFGVGRPTLRRGERVSLFAERSIFGERSIFT